MLRAAAGTILAASRRSPKICRRRRRSRPSRLLPGLLRKSGRAGGSARALVGRILQPAFGSHRGREASCSSEQSFKTDHLSERRDLCRRLAQARGGHAKRFSDGAAGLMASHGQGIGLPGGESESCLVGRLQGLPLEGILAKVAPSPPSLRHDGLLMLLLWLLLVGGRERSRRLARGGPHWRRRRRWEAKWSWKLCEGHNCCTDKQTDGPAAQFVLFSMLCVSFALGKALGSARRRQRRA